MKLPNATIRLMRSVLRLHPMLVDKELRDAYNQCEAALEYKPAKGKCLMRNSGLALTDVQFEGELSKADPKYYYEACMDWSDSMGQMRIDWMATLRGFARRDLKDGKLKVSSHKQITGTNESIEPIIREPVSKSAMTIEQWRESDEYKSKFKR